MTPLPLGILALAGVTGGAPAFDLLATTTLNSTATSVTFSGLGSYTDYKHLQLRFIANGGSGGNFSTACQLQFNGDTSSSYTTHRLWATGAGGVGNNHDGTNTYTMLTNALGGSSDSSEFGAGITDIYDFASTSKKTVVRTLSGKTGNNKQVTMHDGLWYSAAAVTSLKLIPETSPFNVGSRFAIYGVR
tara:strand:+ start:391 stop:957 length:567 start_codon:yes stop_codon:yes gene_type:complete